MIKELEDIVKAMDLINQQISKRLLRSNNTKMKVSLDALDKLWLTHVDGKISITGPWGIESFPKVPSWITFETDSANFRIIAEANPYTPEIALLLIEIWKHMSADASILLEQHVFSALEYIEARWKTTGEPNPSEQRGIIGEIEAVIHTHAVKGKDAVTNWDHTSHALHDIKGDGWAVEAKSTGASSDTVSISSLNQLKWVEGVNLVLSVTTVSRDESDDGVTLPEYLDKKVNDLQSVDPDSANLLKIKLQACGHTEATRPRYSLKWKVPESENTSFYLIEEDSPTNWWSNEDLSPVKPKEIVVNKYNLDLKSKAFVAKPIKDILP